MNETEQCRLCTNVSDKIKPEKIFEPNHRHLLQQIEELIGQKLKKAKGLPQYICNSCEEQLLTAHAFRTQCIQAQQLFAAQTKPRKRKLKDGVAVEVSIEEDILNELNPVQVEDVEMEKEANKLPQQPVTEEEVAIDEGVLNGLLPVKVENIEMEDYTIQLPQQPVSEEPEVLVDERDLNELMPVKEEPIDMEHESMQFPPHLLGDQALFNFGHTIFDSHPTAAIHEDAAAYDSDSNAINEDDSNENDNQPEAAINVVKSKDGVGPLNEGQYAADEQNMTIVPDTTQPNMMFESIYNIKKEKIDNDSDCSFNPLDEGQYNSDGDDMSKKRKRYCTKNEKPNKSTTNEDKPYICKLCGKGFKVNSLLETHMRRHTGDKKFKCEECSDRFFLNADLKRHMRKHTGELPYPCCHCERRFMDASSARKHERTHTNERPYVCNLCGKGFNVAHTLTNHMLSHSNERAFLCELCQVAFKLKKHLVTHYRSRTHQENLEKMIMINQMQVVKPEVLM